jgi:hypothetical protein
MSFANPDAYPGTLFNSVQLTKTTALAIVIYTDMFRTLLSGDYYGVGTY